MRDLKQAQAFLMMAKKNLKALVHMTDAEAFDTEVFGFHAQQAVEKALKAWLCSAGVMVPRIHQIEELICLLEDRGIPVSQGICRLRDLTDFAVVYRYDPYTTFDEALDRPRLAREIQELVTHVAGLVGDQGT